MERSLEVFCAINEKYSRFDIMFLLEFSQEDIDQGGRGRRKGLDMRKSFVRDLRRHTARITVRDTNHCFVERNLIRTLARFWL